MKPSTFRRVSLKSNEIWKEVPGYPGYEVSSFGEVRSKARTVVQRNGHPYTVAEKILLQNPTSKGYLAVGLSRDGKSSTKMVHILVAMAFLGKKRAGHEVRHLDGRKQNNKAINLEYGTHQDNSDDMVRHGTSCIGVKNPKAKLTESKVRKIRTLCRRYSNTELATKFGVSVATIGHIVNNVTWKHISL